MKYIRPAILNLGYASSFQGARQILTGKKIFQRIQTFPFSGDFIGILRHRLLISMYSGRRLMGSRIMGSIG
jgi:hypothetical protein